MASEETPRRKTVYHQSPFGTLEHPWLQKADTKFKPEGEFKTELLLEGADAGKLKDLVDAEVDKAWELWEEKSTERKMKKSERDAYKKHYPYEVVTDEDDNPTGVIKFSFRQNARLRGRDGEMKDIAITIVDASGKTAITKPIFTGSTARVMFSCRPIEVVSAKTVGIRLDFSMVQVVKLQQGGAMGGFGAVEGYTEGTTGGGGEQGETTSDDDYA